MRIFIISELAHEESINLALGELADIVWIRPHEDATCNATTSDVLVLLDGTRNCSSALDQIHSTRSRGQRVPIFVVAGLWTKEDSIRALEAGADDCLVGEFVCRELRARICALVRRSSGLWILASDGQLSLS